MRLNIDPGVMSVFLEAEHDGYASADHILGHSVCSGYFDKYLKLLAGLKPEIPGPQKVLLLIGVYDIPVRINHPELDIGKGIGSADRDPVIGVRIEGLVQFSLLSNGEYGGMIVPVMYIGVQLDLA